MTETKSLKQIFREFELGKSPEKSLVEIREHLNEAQVLSLMLHMSICNYDHNDYCGFYYADLSNEYSWTKGDQKKWLEKAENILKIVTFDEAYEIARLL